MSFMEAPFERLARDDFMTCHHFLHVQTSASPSLHLQPEHSLGFEVCLQKSGPSWHGWTWPKHPVFKHVLSPEHTPAPPANATCCGASTMLTPTKSMPTNPRTNAAT
jgi:hypothetical protein